MSRARFLTALACVTAVGLLVRVVVSYQLYASFSPVAHPGDATDMKTYATLAGRVLAGDYPYWTEGFRYQPFYYAVFLPAVYLVFGTGPVGPIVVNCLLGAGVIWLVGLTFARVFGEAEALAAAGLMALFRFHVFSTPLNLTEPLQCLWTILFVYAAVAAWRKPSIARWAAAGLVLGLAGATRGNAPAWLPVALCLLAASPWEGRRGRALAAAGLFVVLFALPQAPFSYVNSRVYGGFVGPAAFGDLNVALGNNPESPPGNREPASGPGPIEESETGKYWVALTELRDERHVGATRLVWDWVERQPLALPELKLRSFLLFWNRIEIPQNVTSVFEPGRAPSPLLETPLFVSFAVLGPLSLFGMGVALARRRADAVFVVACVWVFCATIVVLWALERFRLPIAPVLCGFAGLAVVDVWRRAVAVRRERAVRPLAVAVAALAACALFVGLGYQAYRYGWEATAVALARPDGVRSFLGDRWLVKDSGPYNFGGWTDVPAGPGRRFRKTFATDGLGPSSRAVFRVLVYAPPGPLTVTVFAPGGAVERVVESGANAEWREVEIPPPPPGPTAAVEFEVTSATGRQPSVFADAQRDYGRTTVAPAPAAPGEIVSELLLYP